MKQIQIYSVPRDEACENREILRLAGVRRIHRGWYTVQYNGVVLDESTIVSAKRNPSGRIYEKS